MSIRNRNDKRNKYLQVDMSPRTERSGGLSDYSNFRGEVIEYSGDQDNTDVSCCGIILTIFVVFVQCIYLNELQKTNPDLFWIMFISQ
jgi:hypothetical protein